MMRRFTLLSILTALLLLASSGRAADGLSFTRQEDVIYGCKYGTALTMDVFRPRGDANGAGIIMVVSGGFFSSHEAINVAFARPLLDRGYTVFAVVHGSQPRYQVPEIIQDMHRAVRFIRYHARDYGIDPERLGITGASAGGAPFTDHRDRRDQGRPGGTGPRGSGIEPSAGCGLLLPAH
jgi:acetyl esterase/lipase